ncbi:MAG: hypothetical protein WBM41_20805, partial [Arenicellales bacterium]
MHDERISLWVAQNPIYDLGEKYIAIPYGIYPEYLNHYVDVLLEDFEKEKILEHMWINPASHTSRKILPIVDRVSQRTFYQHLAKSKFILSPIGDRDDCCRHIEAIGLGTIPICNLE